MKKSTAIHLFGGRSVDLADALGVTKGRVSQLPDELDRSTTDRVIGAAYRLGLHDRLRELQANDEPVGEKAA